MDCIDKKKLMALFFEIMRFGIVGFISFLFDWGALMLTLHVFLERNLNSFNIAVSTAIGFIVGVTVNYLLSVKFVFKSSSDKGYGKDVKSKVIFFIIAVIGLGLTQLIMNIGVLTLSYNETLVKVGATLIVMVWNYISRKIFIFK